MRRACSVLAVVTAVLALSACDTKVGQAAIVGSHRISDTEVSSYVTRSGPSAAVRSQAAQSGGAIEPRVEALSSLIQQEVYTHVLAASGSMPTGAELASLHDEAIQRLLQAQTSGDAFDTQLATQAKAYGFSDKFSKLVLRVAELEDAVINRSKATNIAAVVAYVAKHPVSISVSRRYGTWSAANLTLDTSANSGLPGFVTFGSGATKDANQ